MIQKYIPYFNIIGQIDYYKRYRVIYTVFVLLAKF